MSNIQPLPTGNSASAEDQFSAGGSPQLEAFNVDDLGTQAASSLHWVNLITGVFTKRYPGRFQADKRADRTLLENLRFVRRELHARQLDYGVIHDLLARIIFIQFLFDRKDSSGKAALDAERLKSLHEQGVLRQLHATLSDVWSSHDFADTGFRPLT